LDIKSLQTPIRAPRANAIAERWVRTVRRECLDHLIPVGERHLRAVLSEFVDYYNRDRLWVPRTRFHRHAAISYS
jgi:transposase InsO family protein